MPARGAAGQRGRSVNAGVERRCDGAVAVRYLLEPVAQARSGCFGIEHEPAGRLVRRVHRGGAVAIARHAVDVGGPAAHHQVAPGEQRGRRPRPTGTTSTRYRERSPSAMWFATLWVLPYIDS